MRQPTDSQPDEKSMGKFMIRAAAMPAGKTIDPRECLQVMHLFHYVLCKTFAGMLFHTGLKN